jgi:hypothetical protein
MLDANKNRIGQVTTGNPARGQETWVYGRAGRPCRRCGAAIRAARHAGQRADPEDRVTFWCSRCQLLRTPALNPSSRLSWDAAPRAGYRPWRDGALAEDGPARITAPKIAGASQAARAPAITISAS